MTGCVLVVRSSDSFGPSAISLAISNCSASDASSSVCRTTGLPAKPFNMPTAWEPCPGKTKANVVMRVIEVLQSCEYRTPGESAADAFHHHVMAGLNPSVPHSLVESKRNRCGRSIAVLIDGHHHFLQRQAEFFRRALHDADVG